MKAFEAHPPEIREQVQAMFDDGKTVAEIATATGISKNTVYKWKSKLGDPQVVAPPTVPNKADGVKSARVKKNIAHASLTPEACGEILAGIFGLFAFVFGPWVSLSESEQKLLGTDLSNCSGFIPKPVAQGITKYTSPVVFFSHLGAVATNRYLTYQQLCAEAEAAERAATNPQTRPIAPRGGVQPEPAYSGARIPATGTTEPVANLAGLNGRLRDVHGPTSDPNAMPPEFGGAGGA